MNAYVALINKVDSRAKHGQRKAYVALIKKKVDSRSKHGQREG